MVLSEFDVYTVRPELIVSDLFRNQFSVYFFRISFCALSPAEISFCVALSAAESMARFKALLLILSFPMCLLGMIPEHLTAPRPNIYSVTSVVSVLSSDASVFSICVFTVDTNGSNTLTKISFSSLILCEIKLCGSVKLVMASQQVMFTIE